MITDKELDRAACKYCRRQRKLGINWADEHYFLSGAKFAQKKNSKLIEYIEHKYGIVVNREDLNNFLNRE